MTDLTDALHSALSAPVAQALSDVTVVASAHPILTFMSFALASVFLLTRSGSAR